jgi:hypothetical protein
MMDEGRPRGKAEPPWAGSPADRPEPPLAEPASGESTPTEATPADAPQSEPEPALGPNEASSAESASAPEEGAAPRAGQSRPKAGPRKRASAPAESASPAEEPAAPPRRAGLEEVPSGSEGGVEAAVASEASDTSEGLFGPPEAPAPVPEEPRPIVAAEWSAGRVGAGQPDPIRFARLHLRTGSLIRARSEYEALAAEGLLDLDGTLDLAEVRWRTADLVGAGLAAAAYVSAGGQNTLGFLIAAEAAAHQDRIVDARDFAFKATGLGLANLEGLFAGIPRRMDWPADVWTGPGIGALARDTRDRRRVLETRVEIIEANARVVEPAPAEAVSVEPAPVEPGAAGAEAEAMAPSVPEATAEAPEVEAHEAESPAAGAFEAGPVEPEAGPPVGAGPSVETEAVESVELEAETAPLAEPPAWQEPAPVEPATTEEPPAWQEPAPSEVAFELPVEAEALVVAQGGAPSQVGLTAIEVEAAPAEGSSATQLGLEEGPATEAEPSIAGPNPWDGEVSAGKGALASGDALVAALHLAVALRTSPAAAPDVIEAIGGRDELALELVRRDALRLLGGEPQTDTYSPAASLIEDSRQVAGSEQPERPASDQVASEQSASEPGEQAAPEQAAPEVPASEQPASEPSDPAGPETPPDDASASIKWE